MEHENELPRQTMLPEDRDAGCLRDWQGYTKAQNEELRLFNLLLVDLLKDIKEPVQASGRHRIGLRTEAFCAIKKVSMGISSRRAKSLYSDAFEKRYLPRSPHYNSVNKFLNKPEVGEILDGLIVSSALPLKVIEKDFAIDSSGFRTNQSGLYVHSKHKTVLRHNWVKAHIMVGVRTNAIVSARITTPKMGDAPQMKVLVKDAVDSGFDVQEVSADKAYLSRENYEAVSKVGGRAYIPFTSNVTGNARGSLLWSKMFIDFQLQQDRFMEHYHKRSNVESTFGAVKRKYGETLKSKNQVAQFNELRCKFIAFNISMVVRAMFELGIEVDFSKF